MLGFRRGFPTVTPRRLEWEGRSGNPAREGMVGLEGVSER